MAVEVLENEHTQQEQVPGAQMRVCDILFRERFLKNTECWKNEGLEQSLLCELSWLNMLLRGLNTIKHARKA